MANRALIGVWRYTADAYREDFDVLPALRGVVDVMTASKPTRMVWNCLPMLTGALILSACGEPQELERLRTENAALKRELEDLKTTPAALLAQVTAALEAGRVADARGAVTRLSDRHPNTPEREAAIEAIAEFDSRLEAERLAAEARKETEAREKARRLAAATTRMVKDRDDVRGITWYKDRSSDPPITIANYEEPRNRFYLYFGVPDAGGNPWLRFKTQYFGDDWLFVQKFIIAADDARLQSGPVDFERDNGSGDIWEWYDTNVTSTELAWMRAVIASKSTTIRFEGQQYYSDKTVTATQKAALQNVLDAFVAVGGKLPE